MTDMNDYDGMRRDLDLRIEKNELENEWLTLEKRIVNITRRLNAGSFDSAVARRDHSEQERNLAAIKLRQAENLLLQADVEVEREELTESMRATMLSENLSDRFEQISLVRFGGRDGLPLPPSFTKFSAEQEKPRWKPEQLLPESMRQPRP